MIAVYLDMAGDKALGKSPKSVHSVAGWNNSLPMNLTGYWLSADDKSTNAESIRQAMASCKPAVPLYEPKKPESKGNS